jgi:hypothetical protein
MTYNAQSFQGQICTPQITMRILVACIEIFWSCRDIYHTSFDRSLVYCLWNCCLPGWFHRKKEYETLSLFPKTPHHFSIFKKLIIISFFWYHQMPCGLYDILPIILCCAFIKILIFSTKDIFFCNWPKKPSIVLSMGYHHQRYCLCLVCSFFEQWK